MEKKKNICIKCKVSDNRAEWGKLFMGWLYTVSYWWDFYINWYHLLSNSDFLTYLGAVGPSRAQVWDTTCWTLGIALVLLYSKREAVWGIKREEFLESEDLYSWSNFPT